MPDTLRPASTSQMGPGLVLARDFRAAILAPYAPAPRPIITPEVRDWVFAATGRDPAKLDRLVAPSMLADAAAWIIRHGKPVGPLALDAKVDARSVRDDTLRRIYTARLEYDPGAWRIRVVAGWRLYIRHVAYARVRPGEHPDAEPNTRARLQAAVNQFAALAAEVTH